MRERRRKASAKQEQQWPQRGRQRAAGGVGAAASLVQRHAVWTLDRGARRQPFRGSDPHAAQRPPTPPPLATVQRQASAGAMPRTRLHDAARDGDAAAIRRMLEESPGAAMMADDLGWLPLHTACLLGHTAAVQLLLAAAPEAASATDRHGWLPLHRAANYGHAAAVELLLGARTCGVAGLAQQHECEKMMRAGEGGAGKREQQRAGRGRAERTEQCWRWDRERRNWGQGGSGVGTGTARAALKGRATTCRSRPRRPAAGRAARASRPREEVHASWCQAVGPDQTGPAAPRKEAPGRRRPPPHGPVRGNQGPATARLWRSVWGTWSKKKSYQTWPGCAFTQHQMEP